MFGLGTIAVFDDDLGEQPYALDFEWEPGCQCGNCFNCDDESFTLCELSDADGTIITDLGTLQNAQAWLSSPRGMREAADAMGPMAGPWALSDDYTARAAQTAFVWKS
jgi:hypothetical protein